MKMLPLILTLLFSGTAFADTLNCDFGSVAAPDAKKSVDLDANGNAYLNFFDGSSYNFEASVSSGAISYVTINDVKTMVQTSAGPGATGGQSVTARLSERTLTASASCVIE
jgi:hypothetical protein